MTNKFVIYTITNLVNGKKYVGQSVQVSSRWINHRYALNANRHHSAKLQRAWNKYGEDNFVFDIVAQAETVEELNELEQQYIAQFDSLQNGYNVQEGGVLRGQNAIPCLWNGITYRSYAEAARATGHSDKFLTYWHQKEVYCDDEVVPRYKVACTWNGCEYESLSDACEANGIRCVATLKYWLSCGHKCDDDLTSHNKPCRWNGEEYPSISIGAEALGISVSTLSNRLQKGYSSDSELVGVHGLPRPTTWNGIEYPSLKAAAKANNIEYLSTLANWLNKGYTCDAEVPRRQRKSNARGS